MFRYYSELSGGRFPDLLDMTWLSQTVRTQKWLADHLEQPRKPMAKRNEEGSEAQAKLQRGMMFTVLLPKEADSHYAGKRRFARRGRHAHLLVPPQGCQEVPGHLRRSLDP